MVTNVPRCRMSIRAETQFESYCAACHLSNGPGMAAEAPPLDGSPWVTGPEDRLIKIVLHGLRGAVEVGGKTYNQEMPAVGQVLTDAQIASLLSFVRLRFGAVSAPILPATVGMCAPQPGTGMHIGPSTNC